MNPPPSHIPGRRRQPQSFLQLLVSLVSLAPLVIPPQLWALPTGAQVAAGRVSIAQNGRNMTVTQATSAAVVNWQSFNIGSGESMRIAQSGPNAAMLARVTGNDPSSLFGSLKADGKLFLINPKGIVVGQGAVIDTAAFIASTLDVSDAAFMRGGAMTFRGNSDAGIVNLGQITAQEGNVMLFAHTVKNAGTISAPKGTASLAAGTEAFLGSPDDASIMVKVNLPKTEAKTGVENTGVIEAAQAELKAAGGSIYDLAINQAGIMRATGVETKDGHVLLTADGGTVGVSGSVSARNADGSGGEILVGGDLHGANPDVPNATHTVVTSTAKLDASANAPTAAGGKVVVWADQATRFQGTLDAHGAGGGFAEVSGKHGLEFNPVTPANLGAGGTLLLDPDALVVSTGSDVGTSTSGTNPFTFGAAVEPATLNVTTLQNQLATSNVVLDTSNSAGDITFNTAVAWGTSNTLTAKAGGSINLNANITAASGSLVLNPGKAAIPISQGLNPINPKATLAAGSTISVSTLTYGANASAAPANYNITGGTGLGDFQGDLNVGTLNVDLSNGGAGVSTSGANNTIGAFRTVGTGDLNFAQVSNNHGALNVYLNTANASAPQVRITTPGLLTLEAGSSLSFASATDVILASTGSGFVNQAGAGVFGTNARFLIYASTLGAVTKDGLTGSDVYSHPYVANDNVSSFTGPTFFYTTASGLPFLTYTADDKSRTYGASDPTFTETVTGFIGGLTNDVTGTPQFSTTASQSSGVGTYTINVGRGTLASFNYDFQFSPGTLTITAAPLTITANNASRTPNTANPTFGVTYSGLVLGQTSSVVSGLTIGTTATLSSPVGSYPITPSGASAPNYAITYVIGSLTISNNNPLTITANDFTRTYGAANPTFTAAMSGFIGTDTSSIVTGLQFNTSATQSSGVGAYAITPFGATAPGYSISYVPGTLTIARAPLLITPLDASRLYGDANPTFSASASGLVNGDTLSSLSGLALSTTATTASNVGAYPITASGASNPNYSITFGGPAQLTVTPAPITVTFDNKTRVYGDANPALTYTVSGLKNGDAAANSVSVSNVTTTAALTDGIGAYGINGLVLPLSSNYTATGVGGDLTITSRPLTISADNKTKVYGDANPSLTATFSGLASFDSPSVIPNVQLSTTATQTSGVSDLGYGILVTSDLNRNYAITYKFGTMTILPATLTTLAPPDVSRLYGRADPTLPTLDFGGLKLSDTVAGLRASYVNLPAATADAGSYTYGIAIDNPNYKLASSYTGTFRIDPAPLDVQIDSLGRTYGDANPTNISVTATGLAFGQSASSVLKVVNPTDQTTGVGVYSLSAQSTSKNYYVNTTTGGRLQINPRLLTFSIDNITKYYGDPVPDFTFNFGKDGLASFDNITSIIADFKTAVPVGVYTDVGLYRIDPVFKANPNYLVSWTPAYLAIVPRPITLTVNNAIGFGNDNVPAGFTVGDSGLDLIHPPSASNPGYSGFTITATNLPANVSLKDIYPSLQFQVLDQNTPVPVVTATDLSQLFPKTTATAPQATTAPVAPSGDSSTSLSSSVLITTVMPPVIDTTVYAIVDGNIVKNPPAAKQVLDRFAAQTYYVAPTTYANKNYAVTQVTNGVLTMKADPDVVRINLEIALKKDQREAAKKQFANDGKIGAFGLPPDLFPLLRELLGRVLNDELKAGQTGPGSLYYEINGGPGILFTGDQLQEDKILFWLADIHTNSLKQAELLPSLLTYVMDVAGRDPKTYSAADSELITVMTPFVQKAQEDYAAKLKEEKQKWLDAQNSAKGAVDYMMGTTDEYSEVIANAITDVSKSATDKMSAAVQSMVDQSKDTLTTDFTNGTFDPNLKVFVVDSVRVAGAGAGAAVTGALVKFAIANSKGIKGVYRDAQTLNKAFTDITNLMKKSINVTDVDISQMSKDAATRATNELQAKLSEPDVAKEMNDAYQEAYEAALKQRGGATVSQAESAGNKAMEKVASKYANPIMEEVASDLKAQATKQLESQALTKSQEAYNKAISEGKSTGEANQIAEWEKQDYLKKNTTPPDLESKALDRAQVAFEEAVSEGKSVNEANQIAEFTQQDYMTKATQAKTLENQALDHGQEAFEKALSEGKSATEAGKIADQAQQDFVEAAAEARAQQEYKLAVTSNKNSESLATKLASKAKAETLSEVQNLLKSGSTALEDESDNLTLATVKAGTNIAKTVEVTTEDLAGVAAKGAVTGIKAGAVAARLASFTESLALGPGAVVELAIQVAIQAGSSAAERADQDKRLNDLINNGNKPVDLHAMATDQDGRAVMMMGLLAMFSQSGNSSGPLTASNP